MRASERALAYVAAVQAARRVVETAAHAMERKLRQQTGVRPGEPSPQWIKDLVARENKT